MTTIWIKMDPCILFCSNEDLKTFKNRKFMQKQIFVSYSVNKYLFCTFHFFLYQSSLRESDVVMMESVISIRCPITWKVMTDPVKNGYCGHRYEKEAAYQLIKNRGKAAW